jgi:adenine-specific DNA-methyltransferase
MVDKMTKEKKFFNALRDIFVGAIVEGESGYVNLMKIKYNYYLKIEKILQKDIEDKIQKYPDFKEDLFDKLYSFFNRYFTESGSIYFNSTPFHNNIYEKVYTDNKDVILFWKTHMLYYVKTDRIFKSIPVEFDNLKFYFDASEIEHKKSNEKRELIYELKEIKDDNIIVFNVLYSERGKKTKNDQILKEIKKHNINIKEEELERAFRVFEKQSEVDFFINKNAKEFLKEQFKLWLYQYMFDDENIWSTERIEQLQILKDIAYKIIDFISQFEDELVKIWNKPKFVLNSNYVITLDRIAKKDKSLNLLEKILNHKNFNNQIYEWKELGIVDDSFIKEDVIENDLVEKKINEKYKHLPVDTKYFKDLELDIISLFDNLDKSLDGWLIKSENYQALNTILPKFKEKVQTIYIDPPFNTGKDFDYVDRFQDSSWLSLIYDRIALSKNILKEDGSFFLHLDRNADYLGRFLLEKTWPNCYKNDIIWRYFVSGKYPNEFSKDHDRIIFYGNSLKTIFNYEKEIDTQLYNEKKANSQIVVKNNIEYYLYNGELRTFEKQVGETWYINKVKRDGKETFNFNTQKPEELIKRVIRCSTNNKTIVLDFFLGSGTTTAVAHKLKRKWIGIEMGDYFEEFYYDKGERKVGILGRMKEVLAGKGNHEPCGISKEVNWQGGGFFKYYELEQYEDTLRNSKYEEGDLFMIPGKDIYSQYIFMKDKKMLDKLELDYGNNKVKVNLDNIYPNIDIAETLSNLKGKWIKKISQDEVEFEDGEKINIKDLDYKEIKPLIWW